ncbi:hypothetical protein [Plantibacter sp. Leaf314]|uniref:hypothetical protein n=1 Tax=Plantibacter sp. Leaf314 TaxID=1736333 RepID=UPI000AECE94C|nr:hypothetical protein [Plantibacter sp. Leaf314]
MSETWFILWFLGDPVFWDWARTLGAAALGAGATAFFASGAQKAQFRQQLDAQTKQWGNERDAKVIDDSMADARKLVEDFTSVHREIQQHEGSVGAIFGKDSYPEAWSKIWTKERSLKIDVASEYIVDDRTRSEIGRIVRILDQAGDITSEGWHGRSTMSLRRLTLNVTSAAITELGAYIRHAERSTVNDTHLDTLVRIAAAYDDYIDMEIERAEEAGRELVEAERAEAEQAVESAQPETPEQDPPSTTDRG